LRLELKNIKRGKVFTLLQKCIENGTKDFVVENRDFMYRDQHNMLEYNKSNFVIPSYFPA
jgi:hypothetical protein